jgi:glutamate formiminotransferase
VLEAVPNVSEGRDTGVIAEIGRAFATDARLLDVHSDADHNRSVFTLVGEDEGLIQALVAGVARGCELIDLRRHDGVHPWTGAADVVPLVPLRSAEMARARTAALAVGERVARELGVPVFLYGESGAGRRPAFFRRGGLAELRQRIESGELVPEFGPRRVDPATGVVLVGARPPLVAYNVDLRTNDVGVARAIARSVRESSGGMPGVQAIGLQLPRSGRVQVSMNVLDLERSRVHEVLERVRREAAARGVEVEGAELVGLVPARALEAARAARIQVPGLDEAHVLEQAAGL